MISRRAKPEDDAPGHSARSGGGSLPLAFVLPAALAALLLTLLTFLVLPLAELLAPAVPAPLEIRPVRVAPLPDADDTPPPQVSPAALPPPPRATPPPELPQPAPLPLPAPPPAALLAPLPVELAALPAASAAVAVPVAAAQPPTPPPPAGAPQTTAPAVATGTGLATTYDLAEVETRPAGLYQPPPAYPHAARQRGIEGFVEVRFTVGADGRVADAEVVTAEPRGVFDDAARNALLSWRFRPGTREGVPVRVRMQIRIRFDLE
jgi:protein TonB